MQRMNWMMACHIFLMSRMDLPDTQEARAANAAQSKHVQKGCQATLWNQMFFLECNAVVLHLLGPQWFWTHIYETLLVHFPASLCQLGIGKFQCSSRRDFPLECRPFKSSQKNSPRQSLPSVTGVAYILGSGEEGLQLQPENPKIPYEKVWGSGKNWKILLEKNRCEAVRHVLSC